MKQFFRKYFYSFSGDSIWQDVDCVGVFFGIVCIPLALPLFLICYLLNE